MLKHLLVGAAALAFAATAANAETYAIQAGRLIVDAAQAERGPSTVIGSAASTAASQRRPGQSSSTSAVAQSCRE
jgi:hypothetical protein